MEWTAESFCLSAAGCDEELARQVDRLVCRADFSAPGFCLIDLGTASSGQLRQTMIDLMGHLRRQHHAHTGRDIVCQSAGRFDQQVTTKPHRDGGPDESLLLLGYEPTEIDSDVRLLDYSRRAAEMGLTPSEFLDQHNPMFAAGMELLARDTTRVSCFSKSRAQILVVNNSQAPLDPESHRWQGVLHTATVHNPSESSRRVVNSMMLASAPAGSAEPVSAEELREFVATPLVRRRGYDRPDRVDDV